MLAAYLSSGSYTSPEVRTNFTGGGNQFDWALVLRTC